MSKQTGFRPQRRVGLGLELKRLAQEKELKLREFELRSRELDIQAAQQRSPWANPAVVAIAAGLIGWLSTVYTSCEARKMEDVRNAASLEIEREKQQGTLILDAIKTTGVGPDKEQRTAANLVFLADAGLIGAIKPAELARLRVLAKDTLPSLPAPTSVVQGVEFQKSDGLAAELQSQLESALTKYQAHLAGLGLAPAGGTEKVTVEIDSNITDNAYFETHRNLIRVGRRLVSDPEYVLSEYTWAALKAANPTMYPFVTHRDTGLEGFAYGVKFYLTCSYQDDPRVGRNYYKLTETEPQGSRTTLFDLTTSRRYEQVQETFIPHERGEVWGAALWDLRERAGKDKVDRLVVATWKQLKHKSDVDLSSPKAYVDALVNAAREVGIEQDLVRSTMGNRNLK